MRDLAARVCRVAAGGAVAGLSLSLVRPHIFPVFCASDSPRGSLGIAPVATWNDDWDCRDGRVKSHVTRHIVLVRHGQYVEGGRDDSTQVLTDLGRLQAELTGKRLAGYLPEGMRWEKIHQSDMIRAKQTAEIIAAQLPKDVPVLKPNPLLNEGYPADPVPMPRAMWKREDTWKDAPRIEAAFRSLFYRATKVKEENGAVGDPRLLASQTPNKSNPSVNDGEGGGGGSGSGSGSEGGGGGGVGSGEAPAQPAAGHEFELVVCHGNVIRYFVCREGDERARRQTLVLRAKTHVTDIIDTRGVNVFGIRALQMPPELWLRWAVFNCGITHICISPAGRCSILAVGDVGHLDTVGALTYGHYHGYTMTRKSSRL